MQLYTIHNAFLIRNKMFELFLQAVIFMRNFAADLITTKFKKYDED